MCPTPVSVSGDGAGQVTTGSVTDRAGNTATVTTTVSVDRTGPVVTVTGIGSGVFTTGTAPTVGCTATDSLSGLAGACTITGASNPGALGAHTVTVTATDKAGNTTTTTATWQVVYSWSGWQQPVNDTAHQDATASVFKAGSTIPLKFNLTDANGTTVTPGSAPVFLAPIQLGPTTAPVNDTGTTAPADSGTVFKATSGSWQYNWKTTGLTAGYFYKVGVRLDDGTVHYVIIALR
jgi:hypothetical protein